MAKSPKPPTKSEVYSTISQSTGLTRKQIASVFDGLTDTIKKTLGKKGTGVFVVPGLLKLNVIQKPATPSRPGINPFTKEAITIKAKPARKVVKIRALKNLKEMVK